MTDPDIAAVRKGISAGERLVPGTMAEEEFDALAAIARVEIKLEAYAAALRMIERHCVYFDDEINPEVILDVARRALGGKDAAA